MAKSNTFTTPFSFTYKQQIYVRNEEYTVDNKELLDALKKRANELNEKRVAKAKKEAEEAKALQVPGDVTVTPTITVEEMNARIDEAVNAKIAELTVEEDTSKIPEGKAT
jgi:hypothetical protein